MAGQRTSPSQGAHGEAGSDSDNGCEILTQGRETGVCPGLTGAATSMGGGAGKCPRPGGPQVPGSLPRIQNSVSLPEDLEKGAFLEIKVGVYRNTCTQTHK